MTEDRRRNILDFLGGDKLVWLIVLLLMIISLVGISSATSSLASDDKSRIDIMVRQLFTIGGGLVIIFACYLVPRVSWFKFISSFGFIFCVASLLLLDSHKSLGPIRAATINNAWRIFKVGGFQIHIIEVVKVYMVMYLAWALDKCENGHFKLQEKLAEMEHLHWLGNEVWIRIIHLYLPVIIVFGLALPAGNSNAIFIALILGLTLILGRIPWKDVLGLMGAGALVFGLCFFAYSVTKNNPEEKRILSRMDTMFSKSRSVSANIEIVKRSSKNSKEYKEAIDHLRQPYGSLIAIKRGGLIGKGPGKSKQKYVVPIMYEDYMYSFLIEEYGLLVGGIFLLALYLSLLARGSIIARNSTDTYSKVVVAGLCALITGQAMMHIIVNCNIGIHTGQTLPLISYGISAFLCFSLAFGVILSLSRKSADRVQNEIEKSASLADYPDIKEDENDIL